MVRLPRNFPSNIFPLKARPRPQIIRRAAERVLQPEVIREDPDITYLRKPSKERASRQGRGISPREQLCGENLVIRKDRGWSVPIEKCLSINPWSLPLMFKNTSRRDIKKIDKVHVG